MVKLLVKITVKIKVQPAELVSEVRWRKRSLHLSEPWSRETRELGRDYLCEYSSGHE